MHYSSKNYLYILLMSYLDMQEAMLIIPESKVIAQQTKYSLNICYIRKD